MIMDEDDVQKALEARATQAELRIRILQKALDSEILKNKDLKEKVGELNNIISEMRSHIEGLHRMIKKL